MTFSSVSGPWAAPESGRAPYASRPGCGVPRVVQPVVPSAHQQQRDQQRQPDRRADHAAWVSRRQHEAAFLQRVTVPAAKSASNRVTQMITRPGVRIAVPAGAAPGRAAGNPRAAEQAVGTQAERDARAPSRRTATTGWTRRHTEMSRPAAASPYQREARQQAGLGRCHHRGAQVVVQVTPWSRLGRRGQEPRSVGERRLRSSMVRRPPGAAATTRKYGRP